MQDLIFHGGTNGDEHCAQTGVVFGDELHGFVSRRVGANGPEKRRDGVGLDNSERESAREVRIENGHTRRRLIRAGDSFEKKTALVARIGQLATRQIE